MSECSVYVIGDPGAKVRRAFVKVGISSDTRRRLKNLRTACPFAIEALMKWPFPSRSLAQGLERQIHSEFADTRASGEWLFVNACDLVVAIDARASSIYEAVGWV